MNRDEQGRTALHYAAVDGDVPAISRLLSDGEDVGAADKALMTPLHLACQQEQFEAARVLIAAGAPVDAQDGYGNTPLWRAVFAFQGGEPQLIRLLVAAGADLDRRNNSGRSPRDVGLTFDRPGIGSVLG